MNDYSSLIMLDEVFRVVDRQDFDGTEFLVMPIFAGYSLKYLKRDLFKETSFEYLDGLTAVMNENDRIVKRFFDEEVLTRQHVIQSLEQLMKDFKLPKETFLRLTGYLNYLKKQDAKYVIQQNSNVYPDVDKKISNGIYQSN